MVIEANIFPVLIEILRSAEFKTRKEAAWAITNATSGGTPAHIRYLVEQVSLACTCATTYIAEFMLGTHCYPYCDPNFDLTQKKQFGYYYSLYGGLQPA